MTAILIKGENPKHIRLLSELAEQLGETAVRLDEEAAEDLALAGMMDKVKTGKSASRETVFAALGK